MNAPPPLEWHPWYRTRTSLLDWLNDATATPILRLPVLPVTKARYLTEDEDVEALSYQVQVLTLMKRRAWGLAPWTGRPAHYEWTVAVDQYGRFIASDSRLVLEPWRDPTIIT